MAEHLPEKPEFAPRPLAFPVVGVGASAGGLGAFEGFLRGLDPDFEAAYIFVQHLDPTHDSLLAELLAKRTKLRVTQISDGQEIRPGEIFIIPSAAGLTVEGGILNLVNFEAPRGFRRPIDDFFQSLAMDQGANAAAIVLSGTGGDGTVGIRHIKEAGGLTMVQDPNEAAYDGMPSSALATGLVDFVLPIEQMAGTIKRFFTAREQQPSSTEFDRDSFLADILGAVRNHTGHDFSGYKISTVLRRIQRRMHVHDVTRPADYLDLLVDEPKEAEALFKDLLINVTAFFRDPEVFDHIRRDIIPEILQASHANRPIRVWVPGCSSGEEAYSIAILLAEGISRMKIRPEVQIFATDIDEDMLQRARTAVYLPPVVADMPPELLSRYFTSVEDGYEVVPAIRDMVRVSAHSVIKDPPFSRVDLISCRNLLIYFDMKLQSRVLPLFHYALRSDGWMVLGSAENLSGRDDLFTTQARQERIYRKVAKVNSGFVLPLDPRQSETSPLTQKMRSDAANHDGDPGHDRLGRVSRKLLDRYVLPHVIVNERGNILKSSARTAPFLQLPTGVPSQRLLDLATSELRPALRSVLSAIAERRRRIIRRGIEITVDDTDVVTLDVIADPLDSHETMIVFRETRRVHTDDDDVDADVGDFHTEHRIAELEDELSETRLKLRTTVEELETSNEELKSSNEEMMSMNEELQSANEELSTVNEELKTKLDELALVNADQQNFLESTQIATVFVSKSMRVRSFTPVARKMFRFVERDKGRPLLDVRTDIDVDLLRRAIEHALDGKNDIVSQVVVGEDTYSFRALPYIDSDGEIDGAVLVFDDVSKIIRAQELALAQERSATASRHEIERLYESAPVGMALIDAERRYRRINGSLAAYNGLPQADHLGRSISEVLPDIGPRMDKILDHVFETGENVTRWELVAPAPQKPIGPDEVFEVDVYPLSSKSGAVEQVGLIVHRVTEARRLERELRHLMAELQHRVKNSLATVMSIVRLTARNAADRDSLAEALVSRIGALASTHALLTAADWGEVRVKNVIQQELAPYRGDERVRIEGPDFGIGAKGAVTLTLVIHELATNAAKYGALAKKGASLSVLWTLDEGQFRLEWREACKETISEPERYGFGMRFIERTIVLDFDGTVEFDWSEDGLTAVIEAPLKRVAVGADHG